MVVVLMMKDSENDLVVTTMNITQTSGRVRTEAW